MQEEAPHSTSAENVVKGKERPLTFDLPLVDKAVVLQQVPHLRPPGLLPSATHRMSITTLQTAHRRAD